MGHAAGFQPLLPSYRIIGGLDRDRSLTQLTIRRVFAGTDAILVNANVRLQDRPD